MLGANWPQELLLKIHLYLSCTYTLVERAQLEFSGLRVGRVLQHFVVHIKPSSSLGDVFLNSPLSDGRAILGSKQWSSWRFQMCKL